MFYKHGVSTYSCVVCAFLKESNQRNAEIQTQCPGMELSFSIGGLSSLTHDLEHQRGWLVGPGPMLLNLCSPNSSPHFNFSWVSPTVFVPVGIIYRYLLY